MALNLANPDPTEHLHKVRLREHQEIVNKTPDPAYEKYGETIGTKLALRQFFNKVTEKRRPSKELEMKLRYTVFLQPIPYLCKYNEGDEDLQEFEPVFFDSFRQARYTFCRMLDLWYKKARSMKKGSDLP